MNINQISRWWVAAVAAAVSVSAWADPPGRVGRLSVHGGEVLMASGGAEWRSVSQNFPITHGDNVFVPYGGRAEVDFGSGTAWISGNSTVYFERLDDHHFRARLSDGQMVVRLLELDRGETARVDLRNGSVDMIAPGLYRVEANASGTGRGGVDLVHVKAGNAELTSGGRFEPLRAGDAAEFDGYQVGFLNIRGDDAFGAWVDSRDRRFENRRYAYVSPYMVGWRDLEDHGVWREHSAYGWIWMPRRVASDWAPYRFGRWTFVSPWGWTWVDDSPWGFAPFHYGRWVNLGGRWAWAPGPWERRPVYSPALVAWHGQVGNTNINVSIGNSNLVYWTPLSWGEAYYPSYAVSANFWRVINRPYVHPTVSYSATPPRDYRYRNWTVPGGATAVEAGVIASAQPVAPATRAMGPLPTTQQVEAMSMYDRVKPAYKGAYSQGSFDPSQAQPRAMPSTTQIQEAGVVRSMPAQTQPQQQPQAQIPPVQVPSYVPPGRVTPPMPSNAQPIPTRPAPAMAPPPQSLPVREMGVSQQPQMSSGQPPLPPQVQAQPQSQPLPTRKDERSISPTQNRGEALPTRPVPQFVEPVPQLPRSAVGPQAVAPQPAQAAQPVQERKRKVDDSPPDREKPQR